MRRNGIDRCHHPDSYFALLLWRLCVISMNCQELSGAMIAAGIMGHLAIQVILNIAVVTNTIPNTGITLPFISYGGTSIVFLLGEMGLALNVSRQKNNPPPDKPQKNQPCDHALGKHTKLPICHQVHV